MRQRPPGRAPAGPGAKNGRVARGHNKTRGRLGRAEACATPDKLVAQVVGQARRVVREVSELQDMMDRAAVSRCHGWFLSHGARIFFQPLRRRRSTAAAAAAAAPAAAAHCAVCLGKCCVVCTAGCQHAQDKRSWPSARTQTCWRFRRQAPHTPRHLLDFGRRAGCNPHLVCPDHEVTGRDTSWMQS